MADKPYLVECKYCKVIKERANTRPFICTVCKRNCYSSTYYRNKKIVLERDNFQCKLCKNKNNIIAHHLDCSKNNNSPSNLITLCSQCHQYLHGKYSKTELRKSDIYKLTPKFLFTDYGKRIIDNFINRKYLQKVKEKQIVKKRRFFTCKTKLN